MVQPPGMHLDLPLRMVPHLMLCVCNSSYAMVVALVRVAADGVADGGILWLQISQASGKAYPSSRADDSCRD